ncbi:MAG: chemotaxis protein CheW [Spirochaetia bacterium]|nr:chemotaxis protein CheW [Spirochaetia bacterium]
MNETINTSSIGERQYLTFLMGQDQYSLDILMVKEIIAYSDVMKVPMLPDYIKGVINLRNKVVPVIDLSMRFGKGKTEISKLTCIIIIELSKGEKKVEIGIVVDSVSEVISLSGAEIEKTPEFGDDVHADFISGMGRIGERFIIMLNVARVLNVEDISYLEKAANEGKNLLSGAKVR